MDENVEHNSGCWSDYTIYLIGLAYDVSGMVLGSRIPCQRVRRTARKLSNVLTMVRHRRNCCRGLLVLLTFLPA